MHPCGCLPYRRRMSIAALWGARAQVWDIPQFVLKRHLLYLDF